jgi:Bacterial Ig-like domain (group 2)
MKCSDWAFPPAHPSLQPVSEVSSKPIDSASVSNAKCSGHIFHACPTWFTRQDVLSYKRQSMRAVAILLSVTLGLMSCACAMDQPNSVCLTCPDSVRPSTVTPATATIISVTILPDVREIKVSDSVVFYVQIEMSPGIPSPGPPPFWETDNPSVATVDQHGGRLTALALGQVTVSVNLHGVGMTKLLRVVP